MDMQINNQLFLVGGASAGFGKAITQLLVQEGAKVIAIARGEANLSELQKLAPTQIEILVGDITDTSLLPHIVKLIGDRPITGAVINAGGPPAKTVMETNLEDWDDAYKKILRWKIALTQALVKQMLPNHYGRLVFVESSSVKQPLENLVLSNAFRVAVTGMVKTLSQEIAGSGITLNVLAPGSHNTDAIDRIYQKKSEQTGKSIEEVRKQAIQQIPVGALGEAKDFASLAIWLLSPHSKYITGQTITVDGGMVKGT